MFPPGYVFDHQVTFLSPEIEVILIYSSKSGWLSHIVNISLFWFYGSCRKGFSSENVPLLLKGESLFPRGRKKYWVSKCYVQHLSFGSHLLLLLSHPFLLAYPLPNMPLNNYRQIDSQHELANKGKSAVLIESCVGSLLLSHILFPGANSNTECKWGVRRKLSESVCLCVSSSTRALSELSWISGTMQPL